MAKLRGAIVGCGMISQYHLQGWQRIPKVEITALTDIDMASAEKRRNEFYPSANIYSTIQELLTKEKLDFVDILTPPELHAQHCRLAKEAGLHIICQKPLCDSLKDARILIREMKNYSKVFAVHENNRFRPWYRDVISRHQNQFFGEPYFLRFEQINPIEPGEVYKLESWYGIVLEYALHLVDAMIALMGMPERVYARMHYPNQKIRGESMTHLVFEFPQKTAIIDTAWKPAGTEQMSCLFSGSEGEAYYEGTMIRSDKARYRVLKNKDTIVDEIRSPLDDYHESFIFHQQECTNAMLYGASYTQTGEENFKSILCTFAAYESQRQNQVIAISEFEKQS